MIRADLYKMFKSSAIKILFGLTSVCAVILIIMAYQIQQGNMEQDLSGVGFLFSDINMTSILGAVLAGIFICSDFDNKTIHNAVTYGCRRVNIILSKTVTFITGVTFIVLPYAVVAGIALGSGNKFGMGKVGIGFLHLITTEAGNTFEVNDILKLILIAITIILVYAAQVSLCVPLAVAIKKPVLVVAIYYGFTILCAQMTGLAAKSEVLKAIFEAVPYDGSYTNITLSSDMKDIIQAIIISTIFLAAMTVISYLTFRKSELK